MTERAFTIDLARCTGCQTCVIACQDRARRPDGITWLQVQACEGGQYPIPTLYYRPMHCYHCADPPCAAACPTSAITREENGLVLIDAALCIACGNCAEACPFSVIAIEPGGAASKCDGCADQLAAGQRPTCVRACPMRALTYGPIDAARPFNRIVDPDFDDGGIGPAVLYWIRAPSQI